MWEQRELEEELKGGPGNPFITREQAKGLVIEAHKEAQRYFEEKNINKIESCLATISGSALLNDYL